MVLFQLRSLSQYQLLGGVGRNGKVYFSALHLGIILNEPNVHSWAELVASCQWNDILPNVNPLLASGWVIEQHTLRTLLMYRLLTLHTTCICNKLLDMLNWIHFREVPNVDEVIHLEECGLEEGKSFPTWLNEFRLFLLPSSTCDPKRG